MLVPDLYKQPALQSLRRQSVPILLVIASIEGQGIYLDVYSYVDTNGRY